MTNVKAVTAVVDVTVPAATSPAVNPVAKVAQRAAVDAQKAATLRVAVAHAVAVADAVDAQIAQRRVKVKVKDKDSASVLTKTAVLWTPANQA